MRPESVRGYFAQRLQPVTLWVQWTRLFMRIVALGACTLLGAVSSAGQQAGPSEFQIKAAYIYNFGKFVKWPADTRANQEGSFVICVLDQDPFGVTLQSALAGESVDGKPVAIKRLPRAQDAAACHILFISSAQGKDLAGILAAVDDSSVLTVSDMHDFSKRGGMIQFVPNGNRIRFEINLESAEKSHLVLASELLKVAVSVKKPERSGD